jgi:hypothetical protein
MIWICRIIIATSDCMNVFYYLAYLKVMFYNFFLCVESLCHWKHLGCWSNVATSSEINIHTYEYENPIHKNQESAEWLMCVSIITYYIALFQSGIRCLLGIKSTHRSRYSPPRPRISSWPFFPCRYYFLKQIIVLSINLLQNWMN